MNHSDIKHAKTFINVAREFAEISKYDGTHVGAVIVKDGNMISHGVNGYPKGVDDDLVNSLPREDRLKMTIHAEKNALLKLMDQGQIPKGATAYVTHMPCLMCASEMYSVGIKRFVMPKQDSGYTATWVTPNKKLYEIMEDLEIIELTDL